MALTPEQRTARLTERINRNRAEQKRLAKLKRSERNHRLIVAAATIEAVARERGYEQFEIDERRARKIAETYFDYPQVENPVVENPQVDNPQLDNPLAGNQPQQNIETQVDYVRQVEKPVSENPTSVNPTLDSPTPVNHTQFDRCHFTAGQGK